MDLLIATSFNILILSSVYILVSLGFSFLFNMLGLLNFAHGAIYVIGGYFGFFLVVSLGFNHWAALIIVTLGIAVFGLFLEKFCFRPFVGNFNRIMMICIAITVILQTALNIIAGTRTIALPPFVKGVIVTDYFSISNERLVTFAISAVLLLIVIWFVNRTKWGQQFQAIAQDMEGALLLGINVNRSSALACAMGCGLAALAGCLMGAYLGLNPFMGDFMLVKVMMIVMLAGAGSINGILIAGLTLGILDSVLPLLTNGAISDAIAVITVVILLIIRPQGFFGREINITNKSQSSDYVPFNINTTKKKWTQPAIYSGLIVIVALLPLLLNSQYTLHVLILTFVYIIAAVSLRAITISGQFPLAHAGFMGVGAYLTGMASKWLGWSPWFTIPLAALVTMGLGIIISYPFSRLRSLYYAMGSLFFGIGIICIIYAGGMWTGGYSGLTGIPPLFNSKTAYYYFFLGLALFSIIALYRFEFSRIGTNLKAISQSFLVASSVGISEGWYRVLAVGVGCFFVGLAGAGYAHYNMLISPTNFNFMATLWLVMYVLIGGINNFAGPIIGTIILVLIPEFARDLKIFSPFLSAGILLIVVYLMPNGLVGLPQLVKSKIFKRRQATRINNDS